MKRCQAKIEKQDAMFIFCGTDGALAQLALADKCESVEPGVLNGERLTDAEVLDVVAGEIYDLNVLVVPKHIGQYVKRLVLSCIRLRKMKDFVKSTNRNCRGNNNSGT